ncbi:TPA: AlbA family DNA-binding domain-containing protein [Serratia marcescens]
MKTQNTGANKNEFSMGSSRVSLQGQLLDQKHLRALTSKTTDWNEIANDCIAFTNATGGLLLLGMEDGQSTPPTDRHISSGWLDTVRRKLAERTVNVSVLPDVVIAPNGGRYIELRIPRAMAVASTIDVRCFPHVADQSKPVTSDDVMRLASERGALPWETQTTLHIPRSDVNVIIGDSRAIVFGRYVYASRINQRLISTTVCNGRSIEAKQNPSNSRTHP